MSQKTTFQRVLIKLKTLTQVFSCEYCEIFKNTYFEEHLRTAVSIDNLKNDLIARLKYFDQHRFEKFIVADDNDDKVDDFKFD